MQPTYIRSTTNSQGLVLLFDTECFAFSCLKPFLGLDKSNTSIPRLSALFSYLRRQRVSIVFESLTGTTLIKHAKRRRKKKTSSTITGSAKEGCDHRPLVYHFPVTLISPLSLLRTSSAPSRLHLTRCHADGLPRKTPRRGSAHTGVVGRLGLESISPFSCRFSSEHPHTKNHPGHIPGRICSCTWEIPAPAPGSPTNTFALHLCPALVHSTSSTQPRPASSNSHSLLSFCTSPSFYCVYLTCRPLPSTTLDEPRRRMQRCS